jgi:hypothetical protein
MMCPRTKVLRCCVPRTICPTDDASLGRCVLWTMRPLDDAPLDDVSLTDMSRPWTANRRLGITTPTHADTQVCSPNPYTWVALKMACLWTLVQGTHYPRDESSSEKCSGTLPSRPNSHAVQLPYMQTFF